MKGTGYSLNYICFACRRAYKQPSLRTAGGRYVPSGNKKRSSEAAEEIEAVRHRCPQCQEPMACAGRNLIVPPASKGKEWAALEQLILSRTSQMQRTRR